LSAILAPYFFYKDGFIKKPVVPLWTGVATTNKRSEAERELQRMLSSRDVSMGAQLMFDVEEEHFRVMRETSPKEWREFRAEFEAMRGHCVFVPQTVSMIWSLRQQIESRFGVQIVMFNDLVSMLEYKEDNGYEGDGIDDDLSGQPEQ
jgi:hypothetical protein